MSQQRPSADPDPLRRVSADSTATARRRATLIPGVLLLFVSAFALRYVHIDASSFWQDEIVQLRRTTLTLREAWIHRPPDKMPLDYILQGLLIGDRPDEKQARLHACLLGAGFVVALAYWGFRVGGTGLAAVAALLGFALPIHVRFSQESGPYALLMLSETLFLAVVLIPPHEKRKLAGWWVAVTGTLLLCAWSHYLLALPCGIALALTLLRYRGALLPLRRVARGGSAGPVGLSGTLARKGGILGACAGVLLLGLLPLLGPAMASFSGQWGWKTQETRPSAFSATEVPRYPDAFAWGYEPDQSVPLSGALLASVMLAGLMGSRGRERRVTALLCLLISVGTFGATLGTFYILDRWIKERYFVGALPPALMLAAFGMQALAGAAGRLAGVSERTAGRASVALAALLAISQSFWVLEHPVQRDDWRTVVERARLQAGKSTVLLVADWHSIDVLGYYLELFESSIPFRGIFYDADQLQAMLEEGRDVWVFGTHQDWWNIPRQDIARFLGTYARLPLDLPPVEGIEIRRNRSPAGLAADRKLLPLDHLPPGASPLGLIPSGEPSAYLGGGWFFPYPWASPRYRHQLMGEEAEVLLPLESLRPIRLEARLRLAGPAHGEPVSIAIELEGTRVGEWRAETAWREVVVEISEAHLQTGLNLLRLRASQPLRIPIAEEGEVPAVPSIEVAALRIALE